MKREVAFEPQGQLKGPNVWAGSIDVSVCLSCFVLGCLAALSSPKSTSGTLPSLSGSSQIAFPPFLMA